MKDAEAGISIRFVRSFDEDAFRFKVTQWKKATALAHSDDRDIPYYDKMADAMAFLRSRVH